MRKYVFLGLILCLSLYFIGCGDDDDNDDNDNDDNVPIYQSGCDLCQEDSQCCKCCEDGVSQACGDSCISLKNNCYKASGCACWCDG